MAGLWGMNLRSLKDVEENFVAHDVVSKKVYIVSMYLMYTSCSSRNEQKKKKKKKRSRTV